MKHFLQNIFLFVVLSVIFGLGIELYSCLTCDNDHKFKHQYIEKHTADIRTLLLGNSYFENSIDPHYLGDSVFCLAQSGRWIYYDVQILDRYISHMPNLKAVIFPMGYSIPYESYHHHSWRDRDKLDVVNYAAIYKIPYDHFPDCLRYGGYFFSGMWGYCYNMDSSSEIGVDSLGYLELEGQLSNWKSVQNISPTMLEDNQFIVEDIAEYTNYLLKMAQTCASKNVRFVVITPPLHNVYLENTNPQGFEVLRGIVNRINRDILIEYYDYSRDEQFRADSIYYNCSHLNSIGARVFANRVKSDCCL